MTLRLSAPRQLLAFAAAPAFVAALAGAALAQPYGGAGGPGGPSGAAQYGAPPGQPAAAAPGRPPPGQGYGGQSQSELASLHAALRITAGQEGAWRAFVAASQPDPQQQARERAAEQMLPTLTSPQRVDLSIAAMEADLDTLRERGRALKAFYATLTPSQQAAFDRQTLPRQQSQDGPY
jgi:hypothetical protein